MSQQTEFTDLPDEVIKLIIGRIATGELLCHLSLVRLFLRACDSRIMAHRWEFFPLIPGVEALCSTCFR
jgi:hypothetical protein